MFVLFLFLLPILAFGLLFLLIKTVIKFVTNRSGGNIYIFLASISIYFLIGYLIYLFQGVLLPSGNRVLVPEVSIFLWPVMFPVTFFWRG